MDADVALLTRLVGDVATFAGQHWGQRPMLRSSGGGFGDLLSIDEVERLLLSSARRPSFRLVQDGMTLPTERSTSTVRIGGTQLDDVADLDRIAEAVDGGATLVLQGLQRTSLPLADFCRSLERATSHPVQANAYLTPAGAAGLARHHDDHDVLVLQVAGSKAWKVDDLGAITMTAGDVLYLPAATAHAAEAQSEASLHLTVGLLRVTYRQVLRRALAPLPALDRALPLGYARPDQAAALAAELGRVLSEVATTIADIDAAQLAEAEQHQARTRRRPLATGRLRSILSLPHLDGTTMVSVLAGHGARIADGVAEDGRLVLELVDRRLRLPTVTRPALERLLDGGSVRVDALPGIDSPSQLVLVRRLVREGLLITDRDPA